MIENRINYLNKITNSPTTPWKRVDGVSVANIGNFHLSKECGGFCVHHIQSENGAVDTPISRLHIAKKELFSKLCSFINGYEFKIEIKSLK